MKYDVDYEIYKYLNEQADNYIPFLDLLKQNHFTFKEAQKSVKRFRKHFNNLLSKYSIGNQNIVVTCYDLMDRIYSNPENTDLQYLYICVVTDFGLLNKINSYDRTEEQEIRNYFRQKELINELSAFLKSQLKNRRKLNKLREYMKRSIIVKNIECDEEFNLLYHLTIQHTFLHEGIGNVTYKDNLNELLVHINSNEKLISVKPYVIYSVLTRKRGMMLKRENFIPNLRAVFKYQSYNIYSDNGKNFNNYQSNIELYDHLRRAYADESYIDTELCDFCFANLSPLSEWYYTHCEQDFEIPMLISRKIYQTKPLSFPMIFRYDDFRNIESEDFERKHPEIYSEWEKITSDDLAHKFLTVLYNSEDISQCAKVLPYYKEYPKYAELFLYQYSETSLEYEMLDASMQFVKI